MSDGDGDDIVKEFHEFLETCANKRRKTIFNAVVVATLRMASPTQHPSTPKRKDGSPFSRSDHCSGMTPSEFKKRYRLTTHAFDELLVRLRPELSSHDILQARRSKGDSNFLPTFFISLSLFL
jgi:hypothetical protein